MWYQEYLKTKHWKEIREKKLAESSVCELCGSDSYLNIHHNCYDNLHNEKMEDLNTLCAKCHSIAHRSQITDVENIIILSKEQVGKLKALPPIEIHLLFQIYNGLDHTQVFNLGEIKGNKNLTKREKLVHLKNINNSKICNIQLRGSQLVVSIDKEFTYKELAQFIVLDKREVSKFSSKYSLLMYIFTRQYKNLGTYLIPIDEFRQYFQVPPSYQMCTITDRILNYCTKEINENTTYRIKIDKVKRGRKITHLKIYMIDTDLRRID